MGILFSPTPHRIAIPVGEAGGRRNSLRNGSRPIPLFRRAPYDLAPYTSPIEKKKPLQPSERVAVHALLRLGDCLTEFSRVSRIKRRSARSDPRRREKFCQSVWRA